ncbi:hypothetical protein [Bradyrhizobium sp. 33ap4]|uniref:hypothetical protein n=1 Tax=Bradyrhizobium sp. 33ap4 TaxID=3061630 RepID=UPI0029314D4C|nr:hypothetical protein [Bradyrhizobium sp. 33ap4]
MDEDAEEQHWNRDTVIEYVTLELTKRKMSRVDKPISLPIEAAEILLECAIAGRGKGHGRTGRPRDLIKDRQIESVARSWARQRKSELRAGGMNATDAEHEAAKDAKELLAQRYGWTLKVSTIKRMMQTGD